MLSSTIYMISKQVHSTALFRITISVTTTRAFFPMGRIAAMIFPAPSRWCADISSMSARHWWSSMALMVTGLIWWAFSMSIRWMKCLKSAVTSKRMHWFMGKAGICLLCLHMTRKRALSTRTRWKISAISTITSAIQPKARRPMTRSMSKAIWQVISIRLLPCVLPSQEMCFPAHTSTGLIHHARQSMVWKHMITVLPGIRCGHVVHRKTMISVLPGCAC